MVVLAPFAAPAVAQTFAAAVSPPRFELTVRPGERTRQVVEIHNTAPEAATYRMYTADWTLGADGGVTFVDEAGFRSCRPWVAIERHEVVVPAGARVRFRFEIEPPADTGDRECRFALMIEGAEQMAQTSAGLSVPYAGRIGVIVYAGVGGAAPDLQVVDATVGESAGRAVPVLHVNNLGNAHGRLAGFLRGTDANGQRLEFEPSTLPILPGETRAIALNPVDRPGSVTEIAFPVKVTGTLEWGTSGRLPVNQSFQK